MHTVLTTGCSSGFGREATQYLFEPTWRVVTTMRTPRAEALQRSEHPRVLALDVTDADSIRQAVDAAGPIDVLVNNAGIGTLGALEGTSMDATRKIFETNTFGAMAMTQAVLPQFRARKSGVIVNITSSVTLRSLPLLSIYTASKAAINAFTESLALELEQFHVRVRLVIPGQAPETQFSDTARSSMQGSMPDAYAGLAKSVFASLANSFGVRRSLDVAEAVWHAANEPSSPMRIAAGADAELLAAV